MPFPASFRAAAAAALRSRPTGLPTIALSRGYSRPSRIWYRPDGTRRSKLKGAVYVTAVATALLMYEGARIILRSQPSIVFVAKLQQIDSKHPIDESSTLSDVVAYILALGDIISLIAPELEPNYMAKLAEAHQAVSQATPEHNDNVRNILWDVHKIFARGDQPFTEETAHEVIETFDKFRAELWKMKEIMADPERTDKRN